MQLDSGQRGVSLESAAVMTLPHLQEAALGEDVADELIQVHQTLVVPYVMGEDGQHHGVLWRKDKSGGVNMGPLSRKGGGGERQGWLQRERLKRKTEG